MTSRLTTYFLGVNQLEQKKERKVRSDRKNRMTLRLAKQDHNRIRALAFNCGISINRVAELLLMAALESDYIIDNIYAAHPPGSLKETNPLNSFFNMLEQRLQYKHWYFGHFHDDIEMDDKHTLVYHNMINVLRGNVF